MWRVHTVGVVVVLVFTCFAVAAASAFAESEWLFNNSPVIVSLAVELSAEIVYSDNGTGTEVLCDDIFIATVKGNKGQIAGVANLSLIEESTTNLAGTTVKEMDCTLVKAGVCALSTGALIGFIPLNLPWVSEISLDESVFIDKVSGMEYELSCPTVVGTLTDVCTQEPEVELTNSVSDVLMEIRFDSLSGVLGNCSIGGGKQQLIVSEGTSQIESVEAGTLAVS